MGSSLVGVDISSAQMATERAGTYHGGVFQVLYEIMYIEDRDSANRYGRNYDVTVAKLIEQPEYFLREIINEWPEILEVNRKLLKGEKLSEIDEQWINEIAEATGWRRDDVIEDIKGIRVDPFRRVERYERLFEEYYRKALEYRDKGDRRQAGEKIWGATTALIKLYAATKNLLVTHWSSGKLHNFIANNVEPQYRELFRNLLSIALNLHVNFYEDVLEDEAFKQIWDKTLELLEQAKKIVEKSKER